MSDATIVAIVMLAGVFVVMSITIMKVGVEGAVKLWSVMGALTGVAFGSITSYYFTNKANQQEIRQVKAEKMAVELALNNAAFKAMEVNKVMSPIAAAFKGEKTSPASFPISSQTIWSIPKSERTEFENKMDIAIMQLNDIKELRKKVNIEKKGGVAKNAECTK